MRRYPIPRTALRVPVSLGASSAFCRHRFAALEGGGGAVSSSKMAGSRMEGMPSQSAISGEAGDLTDRQTDRQYTSGRRSKKYHKGGKNQPMGTAREFIQLKPVLDGVWTAHSARRAPSSRVARRALGIVLLLVAGSFPSPAARSRAAIAAGPNHARQFLCQFDCRDRSFLCCTSEGGCNTCFDFGITYGRKEIIAYGDPDVCESPPDSRGSRGICFIRMNICLALECLIEPPPPRGGEL
jgi:hypothetical protein